MSKGHAWQVELHVHFGKGLTQVERLGRRSVCLAAPESGKPHARALEIEQYERVPYIRVDKAALFANAFALGASIRLPCYVEWKGRECEAVLELTP